MPVQIRRHSLIDRLARSNGVIVDDEFRRAVYAELALQIREGRSRWQVDTGESRAGWRSAATGLRNRVSYARYVRPPGRSVGQSLRDARAFANRALPDIVRRLARRKLRGQSLRVLRGGRRRSFSRPSPARRR